MKTIAKDIASALRRLIQKDRAIQGDDELDARVQALIQGPSKSFCIYCGKYATLSADLLCSDCEHYDEFECRLWVSDEHEETWEEVEPCDETWSPKPWFFRLGHELLCRAYGLGLPMRLAGFLGNLLVGFERLWHDHAWEHRS